MFSAEEGTMFGDRTFVVLGFCLDDQKQLQTFIKENGGKFRARIIPPRVGHLHSIRANV